MIKIPTLEECLPDMGRDELIGTIQDQQEYVEQLHGEILALKGKLADTREELAVHQMYSCRPIRPEVEWRAAQQLGCKVCEKTEKDQQDG